MRLPTIEELNELRGKCTWIRTNLNGIKGYKVIGPNGNFIFLPAAGYRDYSRLYDAGSYGDYWSSSLSASYSNSAYCLSFGSGYVGLFSAYCSRRFPVRAVSNTEGINLGLSVKWMPCNYGANSPKEFGEYLSYDEAIKINFNIPRPTIF